MILFCTVILYCNAGEGDGWRLSLTESLGGLLVREKVAQVARLYCTVLHCTVLYCTVQAARLVSRLDQTLDAVFTLFVPGNNITTISWVQVNIIHGFRSISDKILVVIRLLPLHANFQTFFALFIHVFLDLFY